MKPPPGIDLRRMNVAPYTVRGNSWHKVRLMLRMDSTKLCVAAVVILLLIAGCFYASKAISAKFAVLHDSTTEEEPATVYLRFRVIEPEYLQKGFPAYATKLQQGECLLEIDAAELFYLFNLMGDKRISAAAAPLDFSSGITKQVTLFGSDHVDDIHTFKLCADTLPSGMNLRVNQSSSCRLLRDGGCIASIPQPEGTAYLLITGG